MVRHSIGLVLVERRFDERANDPLVFLQVVLSSQLALLCLCRFGAHAGKLRRPIDSWLRTDDYFFGGGSRWMTYSRDGDDLAERLEICDPATRLSALRPPSNPGQFTVIDFVGFC
jgi:hypothetical protein